MIVYLIRALGFANGVPCNHAGQYLQAFDPDAHDGKGEGEFTPSPSFAKHFETKAEAFEFWQQQSTVRPLRPDRKPNRPLTALTVEIAPFAKPGT